MRLREFQPGRDFTPMQIELFGQFQTGKIFQHVQHGFNIGFAAGYLRIAMIARLQGQIIGGNGIPKAFIIHRLQPVLHVVDVPEVSHAPRIAKSESQLQIDTRKAGHP